MSKAKSVAANLTAADDRPGPFVDDRDLERLTPISRPQWQAYRYQRSGPPWRKIGRRVVYKWSDVVAWLESQPAGGK